MKKNYTMLWIVQFVTIVILYSFTAACIVVGPITATISEQIAMEQTTCEPITHQSYHLPVLNESYPMTSIIIKEGCNSVEVRDQRYVTNTPLVIIRVRNDTTVLGTSVLGANQSNPVVAVTFRFPTDQEGLIVEFERTTEDTMFFCCIIARYEGLCQDAFAVYNYELGKVAFVTFLLAVLLSGGFFVWTNILRKPSD